MTKMFDMADSSHEFVDLSVISDAGWQRRGLDFIGPDGAYYAPLYEAKHIHHFDHRWHSGVNSGESEDDSDKNDSDASLATRYWVLRSRVDERLASKNWSKQWLLGWRDITNTTNERTCLLTVYPRTAVAHTLRVAFIAATAPEAAAFQACLSSFSFDYVTRQKVGGTHLTVEALKQLPVLPPATYAELCAWSGQPAVTHRDWLLPRVLELTYTAWDLEPFARDSGWFGPPFVWDEARRFQLRCELDAAFLHLYGLSRADAAYILDTFPIVRRKDEAAHGTYRTRDTILALYDQFADCTAERRAFASAALALPPADPRAAHPPRLPEVPRTAFEGREYFETVLPLLLRMAPAGLERARLFHAITLLTDATLRRTAARSELGDVGGQWAEAFTERYGWADAGEALLAEMQKGRIRGVDQLRLAPEAAVTTGNPWLCLDAFVALRLALAAEPAAARQSESAQQPFVARIIQLAQAA
jgi:hypothetical protein